jgi:hypothetical protein
MKGMEKPPTMDCASIELTQHAHDRILERMIHSRDVKRVIREGEVIEQQTIERRPFPCFLILE